MHTPSQRETHTHIHIHTHTRILKRHGYSRDINIEVGAVASGPRLRAGSSVGTGGAEMWGSGEARGDTRTHAYSIQILYLPFAKFKILSPSRKGMTSFLSPYNHGYACLPLLKSHHPASPIFSLFCHPVSLFLTPLSLRSPHLHHLPPFYLSVVCFQSAIFFLTSISCVSH